MRGWFFQLVTPDGESVEMVRRHRSRFQSRRSDIHQCTYVKDRTFLDVNGPLTSCRCQNGVSSDCALRRWWWPSWSALTARWIACWCFRLGLAFSLSSWDEHFTRLCCCSFLLALQASAGSFSVPLHPGGAIPSLAASLLVPAAL